MALSANGPQSHALWSSSVRSTWQYESDPGDDGTWWGWWGGTISIGSGAIALTSGSQLAVTTNAGATWNSFSTAGALSIYSLTFGVADKLFAVGSRYKTVYRSSDYQTWEQIGTPLPDRVSTIAASTNGEIFVGSASFENPHVFRSTDNGTTFEPRATALGYFEIAGLAVSTSGNVFMVGGPVEANTYYNTLQRLYRSTDHGQSWGKVTMLGMPAGARISSITTDPKGILYFATNLGVFRSAEPM